ncbi:hypothetical protein [Paenibacillus sp. FSL R7-0333]|uniref:hypothetical protein n=1 Tax=Paenibacillus sp. FSL R7-0333 TaxID=1926587 RepID=UPI0026BF5FB5
MNWKKATLPQLYEIAFNDSGAPIMHKHSALAEIQRRQPQRREKVNYKMKKVYPR